MPKNRSALLFASIVSERRNIKSISHQLEKNNWKCCILPQADNELMKESTGAANRSSFVSTSRFVNMAKRLLPSPIKKNLHFLLEYRKFLRLFSRCHFDLVLLGTDVAYITPWITAAAKKSGVLTVVIPFTMSNHEEQLWSAKQRGRVVRWYQPIAQFTRVTFPKWFIRSEGPYWYSTAIFDVLFLEMFRVAPRLPMVVCGGNADHVIVETRFERNYFVESGVCSEKIELARVFCDNGVPVSTEQEVLPPDFVLWSVPPDHIRGGEFATYEDMISFHLSVFSEADTVVVLSPHPRISKDFFIKRDMPRNVFLSDAPIESLLKDCLLFVASQSATIRKALFYNKPVINFRCYHLPYTEYTGVPNVYETDKKDEFQSAFERFCEDGSWGSYPEDSHRMSDLFVSASNSLTEVLSVCLDSRLPLSKHPKGKSAITEEKMN